MQSKRNHIYPKKEIRKNKKGYLACKKCNTSLLYSSYLCNACKMIESSTCEGKIIIKNINEKIKSLLINNIKNRGIKSFKNDPKNRIININEEKKEINILTSKNKLALKIAKKIKKSFKAKMKISYSDKDPLVRIHINLKTAK
ncbi:MAG: NMD3-related protein [Candidatus Paceibacterota bacterium]